MKTQISTIFILFFCLDIFAQAPPRHTLTVETYDSQSMTALRGVSVSYSAGTQGGVSNFRGAFPIKFSGDSVEITLSLVGYQKITCWIKPGTATRIYLKESDTQLGEVQVTGYENHRKLSEIPASIGLLKSNDLERYSNTNLVPALNTLPGVRMEERSPGSYRMSIRGSTLRSPFGVRNVKVYWNEIPLTDPSGNTYLNQIELGNVGRIEVLKGPAGSIYGAGTGGAILLDSPKAPEADQLQARTTVGSFGLFSMNLGIKTHSEKQTTFLNYSKTQADGYRTQSAMRREGLNLQTYFYTDPKRTISANLLYSDLFYQTPGGLTLAQYKANPAQARPTVNTALGAVDQKAAIYLKTLQLGIAQNYDFNEHWTNRTAIYLSQTKAENPSIRNFERRLEPSWGGRSVTNYRFENGLFQGKISGGIEYQQGVSNIKTYGNKRGNVDTLQTDDEVTARQFLAFAQAEFDLPQNFFLTIGGSYNRLNYSFLRLGKNAMLQEKTFDPVFSPRIALLKKINSSLSAYGSISNGFSPPSVAEVRPSEGSFNFALNPEKGTNYEVGIRGNLLRQRLVFDIAAYSFRLQETIVTRRTDDGADYFANAGNTSQKGLEIALKYLVSKSLIFWTNYTLQEYKFENYVTGGKDYSGNRLTGTSPNNVNIGLDFNSSGGFYANATFQFTDKIYLNDANTDAADSYQLLGGKIGYQKKLSKHFKINAFAGIDNALDVTYSLGNDLNATGGRYYNAAAGRNYYGGTTLNWMF